MNFSIFPETIFMKGSRSQTNMQNKSTAGHRPVPQNKDDMDSRSGEEQSIKGDDITHNQKHVRSDNPMRKGKK